MSEQKKIDLSALNKAVLVEDSNPSEKSEVETQTSEKNKNKKLTQKMKQIINGEFVSKAEKDAENKMNSWKGEVLGDKDTENQENLAEAGLIGIIDFGGNKKSDQVEIEEEKTIGNEFGKIKITQNQDLAEEKKENPSELNLEEKNISENSFENSAEENRNLIENRNFEEDSEENELFQNYKSDFENIKNNGNEIGKKSNGGKIFLIIFVILVLGAIIVCGFLFKDKIKEFINPKKVEKVEQPTKTGSEETKSEPTIKAETINISGTEFEYEKITDISGNETYKFEGEEFPSLEKLTSTLEKKVEEEKIKKQKALHDKMIKKIKEEFLEK
ncbi:hypothetical protein D8B46_03255 [Candidatus Gracilibacteria bacterium]|nr:MAG: hypothetical protein D8B46_03255 [Candidatus Gracilibacteria bacterium]